MANDIPQHKRMAMGEKVLKKGGKVDADGDRDMLKENADFMATQGYEHTKGAGAYRKSGSSFKGFKKGGC